jgi:hypothetical protein
MAKGVQWVLLIVLGGVAGLFVGELLASWAPAGFLSELLSKSFSVGIEPPGTLDLRFLSVTLGLQIKLTLFGLLGLVLAFWAGRHL